MDGYGTGYVEILHESGNCGQNERREPHLERVYCVGYS